MWNPFSRLAAAVMQQHDQSADTSKTTTAQAEDQDRDTGPIAFPQPRSHFEQQRDLIDSFDEDRETFLERIVRWTFMLLAYVGPVTIALAIGKELGDGYSGTADIWASGWSLGTHTVSYFGELAIAMMTLASATALRRIKSDNGYVAKLVASLASLLVFSIASGLAQWFIALSHISLTSPAAYVMLVFRVVMVPCVDVASLLYLSIQSYKSLQRYLAEQAQKATSTRAINESELEIQRAQADAERRRREDEAYLQGKEARERVMARVEELQAQALISHAERSLLPAPQERERGYY